MEKITEIGLLTIIQYNLTYKYSTEVSSLWSFDTRAKAHSLDIHRCFVFAMPLLLPCLPFTLVGLCSNNANDLNCEYGTDVFLSLTPMEVFVTCVSLSNSHVVYFSLPLPSRIISLQLTRFTHQHMLETFTKFVFSVFVDSTVKCSWLSLLYSCLCIFKHKFLPFFYALLTFHHLLSRWWHNALLCH